MRPRTSSGKRPTRVAELLRESLATILLQKCADPRLRDITVTEVEMSPDLKLARVFYLLREGVDQEQVQTALVKALGFIKQEVAREHILRTMPELLFLPDQSLERAARLEGLFEKMKETSKPRQENE